VSFKTEHDRHPIPLEHEAARPATCQATPPNREIVRPRCAHGNPEESGAWVRRIYAQPTRHAMYLLGIFSRFSETARLHLRGAPKKNKIESDVYLADDKW
jgi:hypothetical protein